MSVGLDDAISGYVRRSNAAHDQLQRLLEGLQSEDVGTEDVERARSLEEISSVIMTIFASKVEREAELRALDRDGKYQEGMLRIELFAKEQNTRLDLLQREISLLCSLRRSTIEIGETKDAQITQDDQMGNSDSNEQVAEAFEEKSQSSSPSFQYSDGLTVEGRCGEEACTQYGKSVFIRMGYGKFDLGTDFRGYSCVSCSKAVQKVEGFGICRSHIQVETEWKSSKKYKTMWMLSALVSFTAAGGPSQLSSSVQQKLRQGLDITERVIIPAKLICRYSEYIVTVGAITQEPLDEAGESLSESALSEHIKRTLSNWYIVNAL